MVRQGAAAGSVIVAPLGCEGWGPERQGLPCTLVSPSGTQTEARDREAAVEWISPCYSSRPFPHRCGQRRPRRCGDGRLPGARGHGGGGRRALGTRFSFPSAPLPAGGFENRARGLAPQRSEKREALLVGFARLV